MDLDNLTLGQIKEIKALIGLNEKKDSHGYPVGKNVIIRSVTMIYTGKLQEVTESDFVLINCSWIPETERYMQFVADGAHKECEPYPDDLPVYINRGALLDMCELRRELPRSQK